MKPEISCFALGVIQILQLHFCAGNHLKDQHIDITQLSGVGIEANASSSVKLTGIKFPQTSFAEGDKISLEFKTSSLNGLIFHAESHHQKHELSVWVDNGEVRLRILGHCHWLYLRDLAFDDYYVSDGAFHYLVILVKPTGVSFSIDHRDERSFFYAANPVFSCWHIERFFFGLPSPSKTESSSVQPELSMRLDGCIRSFTTQRSNESEDLLINTSYKRVSSCDGL